MKREWLGLLLLLIIVVALAPACREPADGDADADGDVDSDGDSDGDADGDSDGDAEGGDGDVEADAEADAEEQAYCEVATGDEVNECEACLPTGLDDTVHDALTVMFPTADQISAVGSGADLYFIAELDSETLGYAFLSQGYGYEGYLTCLTGVDLGGTSIRVELTESNIYEWTYMLSDRFWDQFRCLDANQIDITRRDWGPYDIDTVTAATTTSHGVIESVWNSLERYEAVASE